DAALPSHTQHACVKQGVQYLADSAEDLRPSLSKAQKIICRYNLPMHKFNAHSTPSRVSHVLILVMGLMWLAMSATGCSSGKTPLQAVVDGISPETPGQVAREAFN